MYRTLYFALQRLRHGVSPEMVREASRLLDGSRERLEEHIVTRLRALHGSRANRDWLRDQPLIERSTLTGAMAQLREQKLGRRVELRRTSGSTGTPFAFVKDIEMTARMDALMWAMYSMHGVNPGDGQARFWGTPTTPWLKRKRRLFDHALHRRRLGAFDIAPDRCEKFFHKLRRFGATHAYGYPTLMTEFVEQCTLAQLDGRDLGLRVVISTGELLVPEVRDRLAAFFGCPIVNEYGCTESGVLAFECESGTMHLAPVAALAEVVRPDGIGSPPGEEGELVVTDLYGSVLPLTRYRLHDRAVARGPVSCACGRKLDAIKVGAGRMDNFIEIPGGRRVYDAILAYSAPPGVLRFRAHQTASDRLDVEILPAPVTDVDATCALFRQRLASALGPSMQIEMRTVADIPFAVSGKLRYFVPLAKARSN